MELLLYQFEESLNCSADLYQDILEVSIAKQESIICADIEGLEQAVRAESDLIEAANRVETQRLRIHHAIAKQMGLPPEELKIKKLLDSWRFHDISGIKKAYTHLKNVLQDLKQVTETNTYLADTSMKLLKEIRNAVFQTTEEETFYGQRGSVQSLANELSLVDVAG